VSDSAWGWHGLCFRSMNTNVEIQLYSDSRDQILEGLQGMFLKSEQCLTRFEPTSDLQRLNRSAGRPQRVSSLLFEALVAAIAAASATQGLFDPTLLPVMEAIGYDRSFEQIRPNEQPVTFPARYRPGGYARIELRPFRREVYLPPGVQLDLGGIGKGWTVDRVADWLAGQGPFLINAGGDLYAYGVPPDQSGWSIGIVDPWQPARDLLQLRVRQRAVATSTLSRRRWKRGGRWMHHLIDPRTGQPAQTDCVSVSVVAHRVALAEVYAKTALILGVEAGQDWLNHLPDVEGLLVQNDGQLLVTDGFSNYIEVTNDNSFARQSLTPERGRTDVVRYRHDGRHPDRVAPVGAGAG
jgi:thiamine biosynthesis lipoprotein